MSFIVASFTIAYHYFDSELVSCGLLFSTALKLRAAKPAVADVNKEILNVSTVKLSAKRTKIDSTDLYFYYSDLGDANNLEQWAEYYETNALPENVRKFYTNKLDGSLKKSEYDIGKISVSAKDTASGFQHVLNVIEYGNRETNIKVEGVMKGVAFVSLSDLGAECGIVNVSEIAMTVGVFTTKDAAFYSMVGVSHNYRVKEYNKVEALSFQLTSYVALIINKVAGVDAGGAEKISFMTRPLEVMGKIFAGKSSVEGGSECDPTSPKCNISFSNSLTMPSKLVVTSTATRESINEYKVYYNEEKKRAIEENKSNAALARRWLMNCSLVDGKDASFSVSQEQQHELLQKRCIGSDAFFEQFVENIFAPKWGYTGTRVADLKAKAVGMWDYESSA